jgi:hypothetical protein
VAIVGSWGFTQRAMNRWEGSPTFIVNLLFDSNPDIVGAGSQKSSHQKDLDGTPKKNRIGYQKISHAFRSVNPIHQRKGRVA